MANRGEHPGWLRGFALSLERLAAEGVASGAVRGAADELRAGLPDALDAQAHTSLEAALTVLERLLAEAAEAPASPLATWSRATAEGAVRGAVEEARRLVPELQPTTRELLDRVKRWLERSASEADARAEVIRLPGDRARVAASGAVAGAAEQLAVALPALAGPASDLAERVGRGLVRGTADEVARQLRRARRGPLGRALLGAGVFALVLLATRRS